MLNRLIVLCLISVLLAGCNTIHGLGKDLEKAGEEIQKKSK